jgi:hypothetical protein
MNDVARADLKISPPRPNQSYFRPLIVLAAVLLLFAAAMSRSFYDGRLSAPMTHDDVNYFIEGIRHLTLVRTQGFTALATDFFRSTLHAPLRTYQAMLAYLIFGITDWAPYTTNIIYIVILLCFAAYLVRDCPLIVLVAVVTYLVAMPLTWNVITEFGPEILCSIFTSIAVVLMLQLPVLDAPLRPRFTAGLFFGIGFLAHPVASPFTMIALFATVTLVFLRDIVWARNYGKLKIGIVNSLLNILLSIWLPTLYMVPRYDEYWQYFYNALFNPATRWVWSNGLTARQHLDFFLFGPGGQAMFGNELLVCATVIGIGIFVSWRRGDRRSLARQAELVVLTFVFWLVPTLSVIKTTFYASTFGFLIIFMTVISLRSIYHGLRAGYGVVAVCALAIAPAVFYRPSHFHVPNTPETVTDREFAWRTIGRLRTVLLGNEPGNHNPRVYMTNIGAYAQNILQYYFLKTDPELDWDFDSKWTDANPQDHVDFIHRWRADFVIAGQRGNGLTYSRFAQPAEDAVFDAMRQDPSYVAIDRFYGPGGREIAVFQRRGSFAGWRPVSGIILPADSPDVARDVPGGLAYLQTFAALPVQADLEIEWVGRIAGQVLRVFVNQQKIADLTFDASEKSSSLKQEINLSPGSNDILLQSDHPLTLRSLVIAPHTSLKSANQGISITSATYGGNCGAPTGNATWDVAASCNGKTDCTYTISVERLGDPARDCGKDFSVSYFCPSQATLRHQEAPKEAGFGSILTLSCPRPGNE